MNRNRVLPTDAGDPWPRRALADAMAQICGFDVETTDLRKLVQSDMFAQTLALAHETELEGGGGASYFKTHFLHCCAALLDEQVPKAVLNVLRSPPPPGARWGSDDFTIAAAQLFGWINLSESDPRLPAISGKERIRTNIWHFPEMLFGARLQEADFNALKPELAKLILGLGWKSPERTELLLNLVDHPYKKSTWAEVISRQWYESSPPNASVLRESLANKRNGVVVNSKHIVGDVRTADCLVATTLYKFAPYLHNQMATLNERQLDSWRKKFEDPAHGLWLETETPHAPEEVEAGWRELTLIYFRYLQQTLFATRLKVEPRIRWKFNGVVIVDTHA